MKIGVWEADYYCLAKPTAGPKYGKLRRLRRLLDFARGQNQEQRNVWEIQWHIEYMLSTNSVAATQFIIVFCPLVGVTGSFGINRIENRRRTFDKSKMYLSTFENVFVQIERCIYPNWGGRDFC